jgi:NADPH:quinone reductase-like Zn-dependent oxidoreductase
MDATAVTTDAEHNRTDQLHLLDHEENGMKAIVADKYGAVDGLKVEEVDKPQVDADRVLLRVHASSVNPADLHSVKGGFIIRLTSGLTKPKQRVPGSDVSGVVEAVGANVTEFRVGDEVFGGCPASLAEYALGGKNLVPKPANISFEQAGSVGVAGLTALQGLRDKAQLRPGQTVLINGAAGGVGTFAVQIAKAFGGEVTGVCSSANVELVQSLGADHVIDYTKQDFSRTGQLYDVVFDLVGNRSLTDLRRSLKPDGILVPVGGAHDRGHGARGLLAPLRLMGRAVLLGRLGKLKVAAFIANFNKQDLNTLRDLIEAGKVNPVIDRTYPLSETPEAMRYLASGHARGKVAITM